MSVINLPQAAHLIRDSSSPTLELWACSAMLVSCLRARADPRSQELGVLQLRALFLFPVLPPHPDPGSEPDG